MAYHIPHNLDFSDADAAKLCELASIANDPQYRPYPCLWVTNGVVCNQHFQPAEFPEHLRLHHGVVGADRTPFTCSWVNCSAEMKKESMIRHINEKHLELRVACPICREQFTRAYTMQNHMSRKHPGN